MFWSTRVQAAIRAASLHLVASLFVALTVAGLIFYAWFPGTLREITNGSTLFLILMAVDVVCGPVLTLVLFNPAKSQSKWRLDLGLIVCMQLAALVYGLGQVASARPVFIAFEGDRFRVVQALDVDSSRLDEAPSALQHLSYFGPKVIGVHLAKIGDPDHLASLQLSIQGLHPAFRPSRWRPYESQVNDVLKQLKPISELRLKNPGKSKILNAFLDETHLNDAQLGYLPLVLDVVTDWVVLVDRSNGVPRAYLHLDGW